VKVIADSLGLMLAEPRTIDLSETNAETDTPLRRIIKTVNPEKYGIRVSDYFV
jgi:hypothetical protein